MTTKKITLIYPFSYGYIDFVVKELKSYPEVIVTDIKTDLIKYSYPNLPVKIWNGITKLFGKNIKKEHFSNQILNKISEKQDIIFVIRPDLLELSLLKKLKENTKSFIAYYYDSCKKYPKQIEISSFFNEIYSYEKEDIEKYNFIETSNFIYNEVIENEEIIYDIFNISSYDTRIDEIEKLSNRLTDAGIKIYFVLFYFEKLVYKNLHSVTKYLSLQETKKLISQSKAMIDIQRKDQKGLSFRTFESLGYRKKLITTNEQVKNFDFYNPNNILIINSENINIEKIKKFLDVPYIEISKDILAQYSLENFTKKIFKL
ncbi:hypothetical protein [Chryseobacterium chendengshani]|uniref:hypothetical protein n=1 Tax=Chryseobacterium sp. LJ756 TaxID=2864113 RepID=UPI001C63EE29|nr:hypothetical protein [Chryseobacterium sp. LJ756]MBW7675745.1 hypothetical protein [Chryseobacterium sp. LJ756]